MVYLGPLFSLNPADTGAAPAEKKEGPGVTGVVTFWVRAMSQAPWECVGGETRAEAPMQGQSGGGHAGASCLRVGCIPLVSGVILLGQAAAVRGAWGPAGLGLARMLGMPGMMGCGALMRPPADSRGKLLGCPNHAHTLCTGLLEEGFL